MKYQFRVAKDLDVMEDARNLADIFHFSLARQYTVNMLIHTLSSSRVIDKVSFASSSFPRGSAYIHLPLHKSLHFFRTFLH